MPTTYSAMVPTARGRTGICIQASCGRPAANIKHRPVTKRPNAIHLGSIANLWPPRQALLSLRPAPASGNRVVSQCKMRGQTSSGKIEVCPGSDGRLRSRARSRLRMVRHCGRLTTLASTCSTTCRRTPRRGIPGKRPPSCFWLLLKAWMTSALRPGKSSLRYSCRPKLVPLRIEGREQRQKAPLCGGAECHDVWRGSSASPAFQRADVSPVPTVDSPPWARPNIYVSSGTFRVGRREARSLSERWPAVPLLGKYLVRFKAIDARKGVACGLPLCS